MYKEMKDLDFICHYHGVSTKGRKNIEISVKQMKTMRWLRKEEFFQLQGELEEFFFS